MSEQNVERWAEKNDPFFGGLFHIFTQLKTFHLTRLQSVHIY